MVKLYKKAQGLPLNTIVIALLVVIVLVVIVLAFTSNIGSANDTLQDNSASKCSNSNSAITVLYPQDKYDIRSSGEAACTATTGAEIIPGVKGNSDSEVCCAIPKEEGSE